VKDINTSGGHSFPKNFVILNDNLIFNAAESVIGKELWKSEGTLDGTVRIKDVWEGVWKESDPNGFIVVDNVLYFVASSPTGRDLWKSDGTMAGTTKISGIFPMSYYYLNIAQALRSGNNLYFLPETNSSPSETTLWKYDLPVATSLASSTEENSQLEIYPVPARNLLNVSINEKFVGGDVRVYTMEAVLVVAETIRQTSFMLDLSKYNSGIYILNISNGKDVLVRKIVKN
jgi:ELWxxDGT repeat protein